MKHLKRFNESLLDEFDINKFDVDESEIKDWLGYFLDEYPELEFKVNPWVSIDPNAAFNIIITHRGESDDLLSDNTPLILERDYPIKPYLPFLDERLQERGLKVAYYDYGIMWSMLKIGVEKL